MKVTKERLGPRQREWRARWVLELLTTDAGQAQGTLCARMPETGQVVGYCCLGIAQRLVAPNSETLRASAHINGTTGLLDSNNGVMPVSNAALFGLNADTQDAAANWNDEDEWDFTRIGRMVAWVTAQGGFDAVEITDEEGHVGWDEPPADFDAEAWAHGALAG